MKDTCRPQGRRMGGFTLVEMAIVLVIIGLILGAVLKGQDLLENARAKRFANFFRQAELAQWSFYDKHGYFAGDESANGRLGEDTGDDDTFGPATDAAGGALEDAEFSSTLSLGTGQFQLRFGNWGAVAAGFKTPLIIVAKDFSAPSTVFSNSEAEYCMAFDTIVDGSPSPNSGKVVIRDGSTTATTTNYATISGGSYASYPAKGTDTNMDACVYIFSSKGI